MQLHQLVLCELKSGRLIVCKALAQPGSFYSQLDKWAKPQTSTMHVHCEHCASVMCAFVQYRRYNMYLR